MKIAEHGRTSAAEPGLTEDSALKRGMATASEEFL
jgi:hypothetical protein